MAIRPLQRVLTLQPLLAILLPFGVVLLCGVLWIKPQIQAEIEARQQQLALAVGMQVEGYLNSGAAMVKAAAAIKAEHLSEQQEHRQSEHEHQYQYQLQLDTLLSSTDIISSMYVVEADGTVSDVALLPGLKRHRADLVGINISNNPLFRELSQNGKSLWSKTFLSVIHGGLVAAYGVRIDGTTLIGEVNLSFLTSFLQQVSTEKDILILVVDHNGQVVADNNGLYTAQQLNISNIPLVRAGIGSEAVATMGFDFVGVGMTGSISPLPRMDWHVLVAKPNAVLYRNAKNISLIALLGVFAALAVGSLFSITIAQKLALRFHALNRHAQRVAQGEGTEEWPTTSIDEFNQLSENLQLMANRLQDSERLYRTLFEELPDGVVLWKSENLKPLQFNTATHDLLGYSRKEFFGVTIEDFHVPASDTEIAEYQQALQREGTVSFEAVHRTKQGEYLSVFVTLRSIELAAEPMILSIHRDITEAKKNVAEIENINKLLSLFVKNSPIYTFIKEVTPDESRVLLASENYQQMIGIPGSQMVGKTMADLFPTDLAVAMTADDWQVVSKGETLELEEELNGRHYTSFKFPIVQGERILLAGYTIDITERKQAEEERLNLEKQILHVQKLESLGVLAGGIAHDFNNILLAITGNADMALRRFSKGGSPEKHLQRIKQAANKAADLAKQMLAYSGKGLFKVEVLDLSLLLEDMLPLLEVSIAKTASLQMNLGSPLAPIEADATQLQQIIMNLVINASEAIGDNTGTITISTFSGPCGKADFQSCRSGEEALPGDCVCLEVADTGCGMDKETVSRLFDPFFTTKFTGRGLGMSAVQGIVRGHQGSIDVESTPGQGTRFKVYLPASSKVVEPVDGLAEHSRWKGSGKALLVDDEETVREVGSEMLKALGFEVITAADGSEGLDAYRAAADIDIVILDLTMPRMDGEQCFAELRKLNPEIKVIMSSGYSALDNTKILMTQGLVGFIQKPYSLESLQETLRKSLLGDS